MIAPTNAAYCGCMRSRWTYARSWNSSLAMVNLPANGLCVGGVVERHSQRGDEERVTSTAAGTPVAADTISAIPAKALVPPTR